MSEPIVADVLAEALMLAANNLGALAMAINRLAATQEHPLVEVKSNPLSWGVARYAEKPDEQTEALRKLEAERQSRFDTKPSAFTHRRSEEE